MAKNLLKRLAALLIVFSILFSLAISISANEKPITVYLDGKQLAFDVNPILENGRTLVPMRVIFEALGADVSWDNSTWTAIATKNDIKIEITIDSNKMLKNDEVIELDVPARLRDSRTLVPVRAVSEGLEAKVDWNNDLRQVIITTEPENTTAAPDSSDNIPEADKTEYSFTELSPSDKEKLLSDVPSLRYTFEQQILPQSFLNDAEYAIQLINAKNSDLLGITEILWTEWLASHIISIQVESEDQYYADNTQEFTEEAFFEIYANIVKNAGLSAEKLFDVAYDTTPSGKKMLLVTFKTADDLLNCKYIAMVVANNSLRCFTSETTFSESTDTNYMLCEITLEGRGSYGVIKNKTDFLKGIDAVLSGELTLGISQSRPLGN